MLCPTNTNLREGGYLNIPLRTRQRETPSKLLLTHPGGLVGVSPMTGARGAPWRVVAAACCQCPLELVPSSLLAKTVVDETHSNQINGDLAGLDRNNIHALATVTMRDLPSNAIPHVNAAFDIALKALAQPPRRDVWRGRLWAPAPTFTAPLLHQPGHPQRAQSKGAHTSLQSRT
jgi:hypothetical protein